MGRLRLARAARTRELARAGLGHLGGRGDLALGGDAHHHAPAVARDPRRRRVLPRGRLARGPTRAPDGLSGSAAGSQISGPLDRLATSLKDNWQRLLEGFVPFLVKGIGSFATLLFSAFIGLSLIHI